MGRKPFAVDCAAIESLKEKTGSRRVHDVRRHDEELQQLAAVHSGGRRIRCALLVVHTKQEHHHDEHRNHGHGKHLVMIICRRKTLHICKRQRETEQLECIHEINVCDAMRRGNRGSAVRKEEMGQQFHV